VMVASATSPRVLGHQRNRERRSVPVDGTPAAVLQVHRRIAMACLPKFAVAAGRWLPRWAPLRTGKSGSVKHWEKKNHRKSG